MVLGVRLNTQPGNQIRERKLGSSRRGIRVPLQENEGGSDEMTPVGSMLRRRRSSRKKRLSVEAVCIR
jgi:hypothetical protein